MTATQFLEIRANLQEQIDKLEEQIREIFDQVEIPPIDKLRKAESKDIFKGNVIYYRITNKRERYWQIISEIRDIDDDFKAYVAEDGCRYGLEGAWVEK